MAFSESRLTFRPTIVVASKRLQLLHELLPTATVMALLVDPTDPGNAEATKTDVQAAARDLRLELHILNASSEPDFDAVFSEVIRLRASGLVIGGGAFFTGPRIGRACCTGRSQRGAGGL
jgi:putative ABC transport system substrate-binding protein